MSTAGTRTYMHAMVSQPDTRSTTARHSGQRAHRCALMRRHRVRSFSVRSLCGTACRRSYQHKVKEALRQTHAELLAGEAIVCGVQALDACLGLALDVRMGKLLAEHTELRMAACIGAPMLSVLGLVHYDQRAASWRRAPEADALLQCPHGLQAHAACLAKHDVDELLWQLSMHRICVALGAAEREAAAVRIALHALELRFDVFAQAPACVRSAEPLCSAAAARRLTRGKMYAGT